MLDIKKRIEVIEGLIQADTIKSLTYAALECRLTLEYLCYERFKQYYAYLSPDDLKKWQPRDVVKQISNDIDENVNKGLSVSISSQKIDGRAPRTKEEYASLDYELVGQQAELNISELHKLWHGLASVALHVPVPSLSSGALEIYGDSQKIKRKVVSAVKYLSELKGNLLMGGPVGEVFIFSCDVCGVSLQKPIEKLHLPSIINCITPKCNESYLLESGSKGQEIMTTRRVIEVPCISCSARMNVQKNAFTGFKFEEELNICCRSCGTVSTVILRAHIKTTNEVQSKGPNSIYAV